MAKSGNTHRRPALLYGCYRKGKGGYMRCKTDLTGEKFGRLTVLERTDNNKHGDVMWLCKCECGKNTVVSNSRLKKGITKSCGCYRAEIKTKHGMHDTRLNRIWRNLKKRCNNSNHRDYNRYGGRGIKVCAEWQEDFVNFYNWAMANGYNENLTLDRMDNNGNYEPSNCRWTTPKTQNNNKRNNHYVLYNGEKLTIAQVAEKTGLPYTTVLNKINKGKTLESTP